MSELKIKSGSKSITFGDDRLLNLNVRTYRQVFGLQGAGFPASRVVDAEVISSVDETDILRNILHRYEEIETSIEVEGYPYPLMRARVTNLAFNTVRTGYFTVDIEIKGDVVEPREEAEVVESSTCPDCSGSGKYVGFTAVDVCKRCEGRGTITH